MIVDFHTHHASQAYAHLRPGASLVDSLDRHGIDHAVVFTLDGFFGDCRLHNEALARFATAHPTRLTGFATVDPRRADAADEVRRAVLELGLRGVKLHPWLQGFSPIEAYMEPVAAAVAALGVPMIFHDGTPPYSTPLQIAVLAERHPDLHVVLGHSGLHDLWPEALEAGRRCPNVWLCLCGPPSLGLRRLIDAVPHERLLFGSDIGFGPDYQATYRQNQLRGLELEDELLAAILGGNAARLLGLTVAP